MRGVRDMGGMGVISPVEVREDSVSEVGEGEWNRPSGTHISRGTNTALFP